MERHFKVRDTGKRVVTDDGEVVGTVERILGTHVHVAPVADLDETLRGRLGWPEADDGTQRLGPDAVAAIEGDEIRLGPEM